MHSASENLNNESSSTQCRAEDLTRMINLSDLVLDIAPLATFNPQSKGETAEDIHNDVMTSGKKTSPKFTNSGKNHGSTRKKGEKSKKILRLIVIVLVILRQKGKIENLGNLWIL